MIYVFDDVLPLRYATELENTALSRNMDYYYSEDITYKDTLKSHNTYPGFGKSLVSNEFVDSKFDFFLPSIYFFCDLLNLELINILQSRLFMQLESGHTSHCNIHIDMNTPHIVFLYYINDSDGDTYFFDETKKKIIKKVTPKKNRVAIFDGSIPHASSYPSSGARCVFNTNVEAFSK